VQLIIGLGNPGSRYEDTWHNLGFFAVDSFAQKYGLVFKAGKGKFYAASGFVDSKKVVIVKPTTYMNLSGIAVAEVLRYFEAGTEDLIVVYDDINIGLGTIRMRKAGSSGGHNGIKSVISSLDTDEFARLRIGFRTEQLDAILSKNPDILPDLVLAKIPSVLKNDIREVIAKSVDALDYLLQNGMDRAMNRFNTASPKESETN
jgi:PTH1 family peptidyl-tRNA hydrolase